MKIIKKSNLILIFFAFIAFLIPFVVVLNNVFSGNVAFWYDPARDFLLALDNIQKITLIGPTSGIPGIFYGPYWIWLLSVGLLFSQDPRIVIFIALTSPYFLVLPFILWKLRTVFGLPTVILLWLLFMFSTGNNYAANPWNPHLAPLLFIVLIYIILTTDFFEKNTSKKYLRTAIIGVICSLIINFHISFGLGVTIGVGLFLLSYISYHLYHKKQKVPLTACGYLMMSFIVGIVITFLPFFLFEIRHGFQQIQTAIKVFSTEGSVVAVTGLSDMLILKSFFETLADLLKIPVHYALIVLVFGIVGLFYKRKTDRNFFNSQEIKLIVLLTTVTFSIAFLYLTSKNPVWKYHFLGIEVIFLFFVGLIISRNKMFQIIITLWVVIWISLQLYSSSIIDRKKFSDLTLGTKGEIVKLIHKDGKETPYIVFAYSPSIYMYEYAYLFKWIAQKDVPYDPGNNPSDADIIYLITPTTRDEKVDDFVNFRTPSDRFETVKTWHIADDTDILKRVRYEEK